MEDARSLSRSTIKRDTSISCHRCYESAHCSQLRVNWHIFFLPFTDRQAQQLFLPLHKSRDCFHTPPTGTVPFIKEIYLEPSRGERQESAERWALIKSFNENVWGSVCYFNATQLGGFLIEWGGVQFAAFNCFYDAESRQRSSISPQTVAAGELSPRLSWCQSLLESEMSRSADCDPAICVCVNGN